MIDIVERLRGEPRKDFCTHQSYVCVPGDCPCDADDMEEAADEIERLRAALQHAYDDCLDAVNKIKTDPFTELGANHKSRLGDISAKDWMVAFAEDVEREIKARAALGEKE